LRRHAVDLALDGEQGVNPRDRLDRNRRFLQPCQIEELAPGMGLACRLDDQPPLRDAS
jgi:hypothetical protein